MKEKFKQMKGIRKKDNQYGITLIALVITVIVLLILAGVSIAMLTGDNGILTQAQNAKEGTEQAGDIEKIRLAISEAQIGESGYQELNFQSFQKALNSQFGEDNAIVSIEEDGTYTISCLSSLKDYTVSGNNVEEVIDWNEKMASAVAPESQDEERNNGVIGIGTDGNPVDMDLWYYTFDDETGGYALNLEEVLAGTVKTAGYRGIVKEDGTIEGTVPQYIKENNGEWIPVTSLYRTFQGDDVTNEELTELATAPKIPTTVKSMEMTFENCKSLTKITCIPGSVKNMNWAFDVYTSLKEIPQIGYGVEDMKGAFAGCSELKKVSVLPETIKNLYYTFANCSSLREVPNIPSSVTNIRQTFWNCTSLEYIDIIIPENVTNIHQTFAGCTNLEGIITVNCNPEDYENFLQNTTKPITITGKSTMLNQIANAGRNDVTVVEE